MRGKNTVVMKKYIKTLGLFSVLLFFISSILMVKDKAFPETADITDFKIGNNAAIEGIYGIDVSHHQGKIDWAKVEKWKNKKIQFVYIKATEGATYRDKTYKKNFKEARLNGFLVGSYHYFRTTSSIQDQFENFIKNVDKDQQDLIPLIDVEEKKNWNDKVFHENFQQFLEMVESHFGSKPMIYTVNSFYNHHLSGRYKSYHFLIGRYGSNPPNMRDKSNWTVWQFSERGKVNGIPKDVDIDVMNKKFSLNDLLLKKT